MYLQIFMVFAWKELNKLRDVYLSKWGIKIIILVTTLALVCMIILNSFKVELLKIEGDVELNPGPYEVIK